MSKRLDKNAERKMYMEVIKEPLEDTLTDIIWTYMNTDHDLHAVTSEILDRGNAAVATKAGYSKEEFLKGNAVLLKGYLAMNLMTGSANPLYVELRTALLNAVDFEALAKKFFEESL